MNYGLTCNGKLLTTDYSNILGCDIPYNPLNLPPYTLRVKYKQGKQPYLYNHTYTKTLIDAENNIWDVTTTDGNTSWSGVLQSQFDELLEVIGANSVNVTNMSHMFSVCTTLSSVALFDTSKVTDMNWMFDRCRALKSVPVYDTSNVTSMQRMFGGCFALESVPLYNTSKVTNMGSMFENCSALESVPVFDTSNVTNMHSMFDTCYALTSVPTFNTSAVTSMDAMFVNCQSLTSVPLFNTSNVTSMEYMFINCYNVESGALALYQQASTQATTPQHVATFRDCGAGNQSGAAELAQIPSDWK